MANWWKESTVLSIKDYLLTAHMAFRDPFNWEKNP